jgi:hypothetical protein
MTTKLTKKYLEDWAAYRALGDFVGSEEGDVLRSAKPHLILHIQEDHRGFECRRELRIDASEGDWDEVISEGYDPIHGPLAPVYWRVVDRGAERFYLSTFRAKREWVINVWGPRGLAYCDPVTGMAFARMETRCG